MWAALLFAATVILYSPALKNGFVNYDDPAYVLANAHVLHGLSWDSVKWAITATSEANWHPLTWISHMADVQLFGLTPRGHHAISLLLHAFNGILLFFLLRKATGATLRSAAVAALFAVHPLNVESVAWIAERKTLLSMLFLLLAFLAYDGYARKRSAARYLLVAVLFALGLAAKPMIVTLPILFLLWDYWPLRRTSVDQQSAEHNSLVGLVAEKIPLLALSVFSSWITLDAQRSGGALGSHFLLPWRFRLENAVYSYIAYLGKGMWPSDLAVFYPHPEGSLAVWKVLLAGLLLIAISLLVWLERRRRPYLFVGWFWYLIAMAPMIGIVQVGRQAMADRYAYLPFVGLFIIVAWGGAELFERFQFSPVIRVSIVSAVLVALASVTWLQISYWRNSITLFSHAIHVTKGNGVAEDNLGTALMQMGRPDLARPHFELAAEYMPDLPTPHYNLGVLDQQQGKLQRAKAEYELALRYSSDATEIAQSRSNLGFLLLDGNDLQAAVQQFSAALALVPGKPNSLLGRGMAEYRLHQLDAAIADLSLAAKTAAIPLADYWLGRSLEDKGETDAAAKAYSIAYQLAPSMTEARDRLDSLRAKR